MKSYRAAILIITFFLSIFGTAIHLSGQTYVMVIDAGSSGSRLYAYRVTINNNFPMIKLLGDKKVEPGISAYEENEELAKTNLEALIEFGSKKYNEDKSKRYRQKPSLYLMATAGMRMLSNTKQQRILEKVTAILKKSETLEFRKALVIPGQYEGLYSWLAANYIDDRFDPYASREGILEMGGASTQIAFQASQEIADFCVKRGIRGRDYLIYSRSFLFLGNDQVRWLVGSPTGCFPAGMEVNKGETGTGNFCDCVNEIKERLLLLCKNLSGGNAANCLYYDGITDVALRGYRGKFFAVSAYYYDLKDIGINLDDGFQPLEIPLNWSPYAKEGWKRDYEKLDKNDKNYQRNYQFLRNRLMNSAYYWSILTHVFRQDCCASRISVQNKLQDAVSGEKTEITWTLGAVLDITLGHQPRGE